jgi:uncharacterized protein (TIGR00369 family)
VTNDAEAGSEGDLASHFLSIPHAEALGMALVKSDADSSIVRLPYAAHLVGDPDTGVIHGGVITALLDNCAGLAVRAPLAEEPGATGIATLDLRIDYMGPAEPGHDLYAEAQCYKRTANVAFVRGRAYQKDPHAPVATCVATFMLGTRTGSEGGTEGTP